MTPAQLADRLEAEPLEGITDAIQAVGIFLAWARAHRDRPQDAGARYRALHWRDDAIAKLQALGKLGKVEE